MRYIWLLSLILLACGLCNGCSSEPSDDVADEEAVANADGQQQGSRSEGAGPSSRESRSSAEVSQEVEGSPETVFAVLTERVLARPNRAFANCDELLETYKAWGQAVVEGEIDLAEDIEAEESTIVLSIGAGEVSLTGTNLQVSGVDEAEYVKSVGEDLFLLLHGRLDIFRVRAQNMPERIASLVLFPGVRNENYFGFGELLVDGERAIVFYNTVRSPERNGGASLVRDTQIFEIDIGEPSKPTVLRVLSLPNSTVQAVRSVNGQVRALFSYSKLPLREGFEGTNLEAWHPTYKMVDPVQGIESNGLVVPCENAHLGLGDVDGPSFAYVLTIDVSEGLRDWDAFMLWAHVKGFYFSEVSLYLLTFDHAGTEIHRIVFPVQGAAGVHGKYR